MCVSVCVCVCLCVSGTISQLHELTILIFLNSLLLWLTVSGEVIPHSVLLWVSPSPQPDTSTRWACPPLVTRLTTSWYHGGGVTTPVTDCMVGRAKIAASTGGMGDTWAGHFNGVWSSGRGVRGKVGEMSLYCGEHHRFDILIVLECNF